MHQTCESPRSGTLSTSRPGVLWRARTDVPEAASYFAPKSRANNPGFFVPAVSSGWP